MEGGHWYVNKMGRRIYERVVGIAQSRVPSPDITMQRLGQNGAIECREYV